MLVYLWLLLVFVLGIIVGSFLNVCVARLPLEKSVLWPGSRCLRCVQAVRWYDNLPLISYWWLRGRCRTCGESFSIRYFLVELLTGLGFVGLFYLEVILNIHDWPAPPGFAAFRIPMGMFPWEWLAGFGFHAILLALLLTASVCDLDRREIPLQLTFTGMGIGLLGAVLLPWPWPYSPSAAMGPIVAATARQGPAPMPWWNLPFGVGPREGLYPWPVWGPPPPWLEPGSWEMGLATGLAGMLAGTLVLRAVAFLFGTGLGKEAMGLGDADLMMMAGSFMGWQPVIVAFLVSVIPALFVGLFQLVIRRDNSLPFGPSLAVGVMMTILCWRWMGPQVQVLFFWPGLMLAMAVVCAAVLLGMSFLLRVGGSAKEKSA